MAVQSENERNKAVVDEYVAAWGGGFPIKVNGEVVGAIGLSGTRAAQNDVELRESRMGFQKNKQRSEYYDAFPPDRADTVRRGQQHPLRPSPLRQDRRSAARLQPALHRHHGLLGPDRDGWLGSRPGGDLVQQRGRLQQLRRGADDVRVDGS